MMISKQWIQRSVLCGLLLGGVVGCAMIASPPVGLIAQSDHAGLATWYDKEAAQLRQKAKDMAEMGVAYRKYPGLGTSARGGLHKVHLVPHCDALVDMYTKAAEEADQLSQEHRSMVK